MNPPNRAVTKKIKATLPQMAPAANPALTIVNSLTNSPNGGTKGSPNVRVAQYNALIPVNTFFFTTIDQSCFLQLPFESEPFFNYGAIPIGQPFLLVIKAGKWRRVIQIANNVGPVTTFTPKPIRSVT